MPTKRTIVNHTFGGGWIADVGTSYNVGLSQSSEVIFPFLTTAQNVFYEPDGAPHKIPGTTKLNSSVMESGDAILGLFDFWLFGTGGSGTNKRVCHVSTKIKADAANGSFADIQTGMTDNAVPCYTVFQGKLIMSNSAGDAPQTYDQATCAALGGTPPAFQFSTYHRNRLWAAGVDATPHTLHYSSANNSAQWNGAGTSGTLTIGSADGDRITGLVSVEADLYVFKGPYYGSIWKVTGSASTGADAFAVSPMPLVKGIGAVWHNSIFKFRNDVGFMWSDGSINSLSNVLNYAGYGEAALSRPIRSYLDANLTLTALKTVTVAVNERRSFAVIAIPISSSTIANQLLLMDYTRNQVWWAEWPAFGTYGSCVARVVDSADSNKIKIFLGGSDGFVRKTDASDRSIDTTTAYTGKAVTPFTNYGTGLLTKTAANMSVCIVPKGNYNLTFGWTRDKNTQQTAQLPQASTSTAWPFVDVFNDPAEGGEFKNIQYEVSNATLSQDFEVHSFAVAVEMGSEETAQLPTAGA